MREDYLDRVNRGSNTINQVIILVGIYKNKNNVQPLKTKHTVLDFFHRVGAYIMHLGTVDHHCEGYGEKNVYHTYPLLLGVVGSVSRDLRWLG